MRFRFTLTHQPRPTPALPPFSEWDSLGDGDKAWTIGPSPTVNLAAGEDSDYLYVFYEFIAGLEYTITVDYNVVYNAGSSNPRTFSFRIMDIMFNTIFTNPQVWPPTPGGTGTISITFTATSDCRIIAIKGNSGSDVDITLSNPELETPEQVNESVEINEPDGWKDITLSLVRDKDFYSLVEFFDGSFIFYGDNGVVNGGLHDIKRWEQISGPDVTILFEAAYSQDDINFIEIYTGQLNMSLAEEMPDNKIRVPVIREDFWAKFVSRKDTPVDLMSARDLDDNVVTETDPIELHLSAQKIRYLGEYNWLDSATYAYEAYNTAYVMQLDWEEVILDDLKKFNLPRVIIPEDDYNVVGIFEAPWPGDYAFDVRIESAGYIVDDDEWRQITSSVQYYLHTVGEARGSSNEFLNDSVSFGADSITVSTFQKTLKLAKGQQVAIYGRSDGVIAPVDLPRRTVFGQRRLDWKTARLATTGNITLSGEQTIDGEMTSTDRVLVKNQGNPEENGLYDSQAGAWTRTTDGDSAADLINTAVYISDGDTQADSAWRQTEESFILDVDANSWVFIISSDERFREYPGTEVQNYFKVTADTTYKSTDCEGFLLHDAGAAIINRYGLGEQNPFYSEVFGSAFTNAREYAENGCYWPYNISKGLQLKGYSLAQKPFFMSFMEWWRGVNPIFNLGLTYEFIPGETVTPLETTVQPLADWTNAGGPYPGLWTFTSPNYPHVSVNGNGGVEGYAVGEVNTMAGQAYAFFFVVQIGDTGSTPISVITVAILDAGYNEVATQEFNYTSHGWKAENVILTPSANGTYVGIRIQNDTPFDTKNYDIQMFIGSSGQQFLLNPDFDNTSAWVHAGSGSPWVIAGGEATLELPSGDSERLEQTFLPGGVGTYLMAFKRTSSNFNFPADSVNWAVSAFDETNTLINGNVEFISGNNTNEYGFAFDSIVPLAAIKMLAQTNTGTDVNIDVDFIYFFGPVATEPIVVIDQNVIRVEERAHFYDDEPVVNISNIRDITRKYDTEKIYNKISIGYEQWQAEEISGIDDPQTKHLYATTFKKIGTAIELYSSFIAASLAIEQTRRQSIEKTKDYKFDNNVFIIALNPDDTSPDTYVPELSERFPVVNNLLNSTTRYNIRLTPGRNFLRYINWLNGCLQSYLDTFYKFTGGEGNYDMESEMDASCLGEDYDGDLLSEKANIPVTEDIIHTVNYYEIEVPLELSDYITIRNNRKKAIGISLFDIDHVPFFIDQLDYKIVSGTASIRGWTKEYFNIHVIEGITPQQTCLPNTECENALTDDLDNILVNENGVCLTW